MAWVQFDPGFSRHPKRLRAGPVASWLWAAAIDYCVEHMTDGMLPAEALSGLVPSLSPRALAREVAVLLQTRALETTDGGLLVHAFLEYQRPAEEIRRDRETGRERARKWRASRRTNAERTPLLTANVRQLSDQSRSDQSRGKQQLVSAEGNGSAGSESATFETWYALYPRHVGKGAARRAWSAAVRKTPAETIYAGLVNLLPVLRAKDEQYRPHPATWLNSERWLDEPVTTAPDEEDDA